MLSVRGRLISFFLVDRDEKVGEDGGWRWEAMGDDFLYTFFPLPSNEHTTAKNRTWHLQSH
jgi:hypothetical protein